MANEQKQKNDICRDLKFLRVPNQFFAHKSKTIWIATVNYQRIAKNLKFFGNFTNSNRQNKDGHAWI